MESCLSQDFLFPYDPFCQLLSSSCSEKHKRERNEERSDLKVCLVGHCLQKKEEDTGAYIDINNGRPDVIVY